jgi:hypothetical protein
MFRSKFSWVITIVTIFLLFCEINLFAQDWHFTDETDTRLPDTISQSNDVEAGDINGNGILSVLVANDPDVSGRYPGVEQLFLNNGLGFFSMADSSVFPQRNDQTHDVILFDIDGDIDLDVVVVNPLYASDYVALNNGNGIFEINWDRLPVDSNIALYGDFADIENDGDIDFCLLGNNQYYDSHKMWVNDGFGYFHNEIYRLPSLYIMYRGIFFSDLNGDLNPDILAVYYDYINLLSGPSVLMNEGSGYFNDESSQRLPQTETFSRSGCVVDIDNDGDDDIILAYSARLGFLINDGTGHFTDETAQRGPLYPPNFGAPQTIIDSDVDNDGVNDLILSMASRKDLLFINNGAGYFEDQSLLRLPQERNYDAPNTAAADFDGDGDIDLFGSMLSRDWNTFFVNSLNVPDSVPPDIKNQTIFPRFDTAQGHYIARLIAVDGIAIPYQLSARVFYSTNGIDYQESNMRYMGAHIYRGVIPAVDSGTTVYYYYEAEDKFHNISRYPAYPPDSVLAFTYLPGYDAIDEDAPPLGDEFTLSAYPNPFNGNILIEFSGGSSKIDLSIFDNSGKLISQFQHISNGKIIWDGTDQDGRDVSSGAYFIRASAGELQKSLKVVLLR